MTGKGRSQNSTADEDFDRQDFILTVRDIYAAGDDTVSTALLWALLSLANHPDVQVRLQKEIDQVIESNRLPSLDDEPRMTYAQAVILETFRLYTPVPLSLPRSTLCDTTIGEIFIPAKTVVRVRLLLSIQNSIYNKLRKLSLEFTRFK